MKLKADLDDTRKYYDNIYLEGQEYSTRPIDSYRIFLKILHPTKGGKILDIGCGPGNLLKNAEDCGLVPFGLDISFEALKIARQNSPKSYIILGIGENLPFPSNYFDNITCLGSLEHFIDMDMALSEMVRISKKDGRLLIMVPNINYRFGAGTKQIEERLLTLQEWKDILNKNGLQIKKIKQDKYFGKLITIKQFINKRGIKVKFKLILKKLFWIFTPIEQTYQFIFICTVK
jgi:ubiquinone/menaquinone biosynthesis C-methylase UbiE